MQLPNPAAPHVAPYLSGDEMVRADFASTHAQASELKRQAKSGQWAKGVSGNPKGRPAGMLNKSTALRNAFVQAKAADVLDVLLNHAFADPNTARWLASRMFGEGTWTPAVDATALYTPEGCQTTLNRVLDA